MGIPVIGCGCRVCVSSDPRDNRLRSSVLVTTGQITTGQTSAQQSSILIDTTTDLRQQALRHPFPGLDGVIYTHTHADHVFGFDELRAFNFLYNKNLPIFGTAETTNDLKRLFPYSILHSAQVEGGAPPLTTLHPFEHFVPFHVGGLQVLPLPINHGTQTITAFRIGDFAYLTDCSAIPAKTKGYLEGLDTLVLSGLRYRAHPTHFTISEAVTAARALRPQKVLLTHISHEVFHQQAEQELAAEHGLDVKLAYDGLELTIG